MNMGCLFGGDKNVLTLGNGDSLHNLVTVLKLLNCIL